METGDVAGHFPSPSLKHRNDEVKRFQVLGKNVNDVDSAELFLPRGKVRNIREVMASCLANAGAERTQIRAAAETPVDVSWLPAAAKAYKISPDIRDYVVAGVPYITSEFPNRNLQGFPSDEILRFRPRFGCVTYKTFIGKPTFRDHKNSDPLQAKGVNLDAVVSYVPKYNVYKIIVLSAFDRTKDPITAKAIARRESNTYSMGAWVEAFSCSCCGAPANRPSCIHFNKYGKGGVTPERHLVYQRCFGIEFFEGSLVQDPADLTAIGDDVYEL